MTQEAPARPRRVWIIANPVSGRGRGEQRALELVRAFQARGVTPELLRTSARGDAPRLARMASSADLVVVIGGDGTLGEVLSGLTDPSTPVGLLPCGTANVLARALELPTRPERAAEVFLRGRLQELDVARVGARLAHLVVGIGFDARIVQNVEAHRRGPITKAVYVTGALRTLARYRPVPLRVTLDGGLLPGEVGMVWIANTPKYADFLRFARDTRLDDGLWEVYLFPTGRRAELVRALVHGLLPRLPGSPIRVHRARSIRVEAAEPVPYQVDGDLGGTTPVSVELLPERFRLVVP
ncbi:MAG: diacylglycerol kinase family lipid kinase [Planctomycetes bacterium]|nr:diacylglycerol kinase family lipid kinase [Planctomycetota bacterium]